MNRPHATGGINRPQATFHTSWPRAGRWPTGFTDFRTRNRSNGFTLIELMIVTGMVGILAAIALPAYQSYTARAQAAEAFVLVEPVQTAVRDYYARWGRFPEGNSAAGVAPPAAYRGRYVRSIEVTAGGAIRVQVQPTSKYTSAFSVYLRPALPVGSENASIIWICDQGMKGMEDTHKEFVISGEIGKDTVPKNDVLPRACRP